LSIEDCRLPIADCRLRDGGVQRSPKSAIGNRKSPINLKQLELEYRYADENWNTDARLGWCD
jgi:hypothetical protein